MEHRTNNRREFIRVPFSTEIEIKAGSSVIRTGFAANISMNGIRVPVPGTGPPAGTACNLSLKLSGATVPVYIRASGTISRSEPGSVAIEFTALDPDSYIHLRQLILNNADDAAKAEQEFDDHWGIKRHGS
ncbi:MAG: hypothetical protein A2010_07110 [Nitrospirae bacterium GWD2_57_9]|nr:MAG: hypothetical protein A2010_07110 [Nitrospirae bacterium GWD2_57_9]OGW47211.1 MAG: hypothetical protein A2078_01875 [Nitrospirae bacterium GWC2_57_9]